MINGGELKDTANVTLNANRTIAMGPTSGSGTGTIDVTANQTLTVNGNVTNNGGGTGSLIKMDTGTLILNGTQSYTGGTTISGGTLQGQIPSSGNFTLNNTTYDLAGNNLTVLNLNGSGNITDSGSAATLTDVTTNTQTFSGTITGPIAFVENGQRQPDPQQRQQQLHGQHHDQRRHAHHRQQCRLQY